MTRFSADGKPIEPNPNAQIFDASPIPHALLDAQGRLNAVNAAFSRLLQRPGLPAAEEIVHPDDIELLTDPVTRLLARESVFERVDVRLIPAGEDPFWARISLAQICDSARRPVGVIASAEDVSDYHAALEHQERSAAAQRQFAAAVSHEIRSPLHAMLGLAELLAEGDLGDRDRRLAEAILRESKALKVVIDDTLDLTRLDAGSVDLAIDTFSPAENLAAVARVCRKRAVEKGLGLTVRVDPLTPHLVRGDEHRLRQILINLVTNAVKFTPTGSVEVEVGPARGDRLRFVVRDTGVGIPIDAQDSIFDPFTRLNAESDETGTGLGLAISLRLLDAMGGDIQLESTVGVGTAFTVTVPLPATRDTATAVARTADDELFGQLAQQPLILVVEDSPVNQLLVTSQLDRLGCRHIVAGDGPEAFGALDAHHDDVDVILMDWHLPGMDGLDVTRRIRNDDDERHRRRIPIVAVTARAMTGDRQRCLDAGMDDFLAKPVSLDRLRDVLATWVTGTIDGDHSPTDAMPSSDVVDRGVLSQLAAELGDLSVVETLVSTFLRELPDRRDAILHASDEEAARRSAHTLKSTAAMLGATELQALCAAIETGADPQGEAPDIASLDALVDETSQAITAAVRTLDQSNETEGTTT